MTDTENIIENIHKSVEICYNNKYVIKDRENETINISDTGITNNNDKEAPIVFRNDTAENGSDIKCTNKTSIHLINCNTCTFYITTKINHLVIERSNFTKMFIKSGTISGIDIISCSDIEIFANNHPVNFIDVSLSKNMNLCIDKNILEDTMITTLFCDNNNLWFINFDTMKMFKMHDKYFDNYFIYTFDTTKKEDEISVICHNIITKTNFTTTNNKVKLQTDTDVIQNENTIKV